MTTYLASIDDVIRFFRRAQKEGFKAVAFEKGGLLEATAPSKKHKYYKLRFGMAYDIFKDWDISPFINKKNIPFCGILIKGKDLDKLREKSKDERKKK